MNQPVNYQSVPYGQTPPNTSVPQTGIKRWHLVATAITAFILGIVAMIAFAFLVDDPTPSDEKISEPEQIDWKLTPAVQSGPELAATECDSKIVDLDGEKFTIKGGVFNPEKFNMAMSMGAGIAPYIDTNASTHVVTTFENGTVESVFSPADGNTQSWLSLNGLIDDNPGLSTTNSLHTVETTVIGSELEPLGLAKAVSATMNGKDLGTCRFGGGS